MKKFSLFIYELYIGLKGSKANLSDAIQYEKEGKSESFIKDNTGWERGHDNNWKFEIGDGQLLLTPIEKISKLSDVLDNNELYKYYPQLKNVNIEITDGLAHAIGDTIVISPSDLKYLYGNEGQRKFLHGLIVHETQHLIQRIEGWNCGAPPIDIIKCSELTNIIQSEINFFQKMKKCDFSKDEIKNKIKTDASNKKYWYELYSYVVLGYTINDLVADLTNDIERIGKQLKLDSDYYSSKGEQEAYAAQRRLGKHDNKLLKNYVTDSNGTKYIGENNG